MRQCASHLTLAIVSITAMTWWTPIAKADVDVCGTVTITNNTGVNANDVHFNMYQDDRPEVTVTGASASSTNCTSTTATQDSAHSANVNGTGCNIPAGGSISIKVCLTMTERNCLKFRDIYFTQDGTPIPPGGGGGGGPPPPNGGWRVIRPFPGGNGGNPIPGGGGQGGQQGGGGAGRWIHRVCYENDGTVPVVITDLKLLASMTLYDTSTLDMSGIVSIDDPANPYPICVPPGGKYCYDFNTTGSYLGGHVYQKWVVRQANPGECGVPLAPLIGGSALPALIPPPPENDPNALLTIGDHPVEALCTEVLEGDNYFVTTNPTSVSFSNTSDYPPIPADFFGPGSEPFDGIIHLGGAPLGGPYGSTDTVVRRLGEADLPNNGSSDTIPIIITGLSLVSVNPIPIIVEDPNQPTTFDVSVPLTQIGQPPAQIQLSNTNDNTVDGIRKPGLQSPNPPGMMLRGQASDSGGGLGLWGTSAFFDVFFLTSIPVPSLPPSSSFDFFFQIHPPSGTGFLPMPHPPQLVWNVNSFFDVFYEVSLDGITTNHYHVHSQIGAGQPLIFQNVAFGGTYNGTSLFDVNIALQASGPINNSLPIMQTQMDGYNHSNSTKFFDVFAELDPNVVQQQGSMSITRTSNDGGTFTSSLPVRPKFIFTNVNPPYDTHVLDGLPPVTTLQLDPHPWSYAPAPGELQIPNLSTNFHPGTQDPLQWQQPDGSPHTVNPTMVPPMATQWRSMRTHTGLGDLAIVLDPAASGNGVSGPTVETRNGGIQRVQVDFDQPVTLVGPIVVTEWKTIAGIMQPPTNYSPTASMLDPDTLEMLINTTDEVCLNINLAGAIENAAGQPLTGDPDCNVRGLIGDTNVNGGVTIADMLVIKSKVSPVQPVLPGNIRFDVNLSGSLTIADMLVAKSRVISPTKQALCP